MGFMSWSCGLSSRTTPKVLVGAASAASFCPSPCEGRGRLGGGCHGSLRCQRHPLPTPPLPSQGREQELAASAAPADMLEVMVCGALREAAAQDRPRLPRTARPG